MGSARASSNLVVVVFFFFWGGGGGGKGKAKFPSSPISDCFLLAFGTDSAGLAQYTGRALVS